VIIMSLDLTAIILTFNEEIHIERCIRSLKPVAQQVFLVDSYSTDRTIEIAQSLGAKVWQHEFINQAKQFQWALDTLPVETEWIMRLDADEYLLPELVDEIKGRLPMLTPDVSGVYLRCREIFLERWIKYGGRNSWRVLRIWRNNRGVMKERWMDEYITLISGNAITFKHTFCNHNLKSIGLWINKHNSYATREALEMLMRKYCPRDKEDDLFYTKRVNSAILKRFIKEKLYPSVPGFWGPCIYFFYRYVIRLGFLDGKEGLAYHFLQGFWYRFLVEVKVLEFDRMLQGLKKQNERVAKIKELSALTLK